MPRWIIIAAFLIALIIIYVMVDPLFYAIFKALGL